MKKGMGKVSRGLGGIVTLVTLLGSSGCGSSSDSGKPASGGSGGTSGAAGSGGTSGAAGMGGAAGGGGTPACSAAPRSLWTWDLTVMPPADVQVPATCYGQSAHAYLFVADDAWGKDMGQAEVDEILAAFEDATPAKPTTGIYPLDVGTFGDPPDVDGDPHVYLFYYPMGTFQGTGFDGYFRSDDEDPGAHSNQLEMLHLNSKGGNKPDSDYMLGVVAHEFVHLIQYRYDKSDEGWLDESLAEAAMTQAGYFTDLPVGKQYAKTTATTPLCVAGYSDYGATFSWGSYMLDRFGPTFLKDVLQDPADGRASIEAHLPTGSTFRDVFGEFMTAVALDQPGTDKRFGFDSIDENALGAETAGAIDSAPHDSKSVPFGARVLRFTPTAAGSLALDVTSADLAKLVVHSIIFDPAAPSGAIVASQDPSAGAITLDVPAGHVVDLVVAVDAGAALAQVDSGPDTTFTYTATFTP